jgi:hypothetical protein
MKKLVVLLGVVLFIGVVVYSTIAPAQVECEVCMEFDGQRVCRLGAGESEEAAARAAQESVCGGNAFGMSEVIVCRGAEPLSVTCTGS